MLHEKLWEQQRQVIKELKDENIEKDKEIEWLINSYAQQLHDYAPFLEENNIEKLKKDIIKRMQQALKEK